MHARISLRLNREKGYMKAVADLMHRLTIVNVAEVYIQCLSL